MATAPIPLTVIGGFLGAGKTSAVNALLADPGERRIAVLVNDFGDLAIDAALIAHRGAAVIGLTNGCVCCSLVSGLAQALLDVLSLRPVPDHIVVEGSGVSDPRRIAQFARSDPRLAPDATIVLVAADQWATLSHDRYVGETVIRQLASATLVVQNKVDLVTADEARIQRDALAALAPAASVVSTTHARLPVEVVLGPLDVPVHAGIALQDAGTRTSSTPATHAQFATRLFRTPACVPRAWLQAALDTLPSAVLRAKGFVRLDESPRTLHLLQAVAGRWTLLPFAPCEVEAESRVVVIGVAEQLAGADLTALTAAFGAAGAPAAPPQAAGAAVQRDTPRSAAR
jgi:G3E family GTPase